MSRKKDIRDWTELIDDLEKMCAMPCKPTRHRLKPDTVIDEDKSVKWNREEVQRQNDLYEQEVKDLNTKKNKFRDSLYDEVIEKIADETGCHFMDAAPFAKPGTADGLHLSPESHASLAKAMYEKVLSILG